MSPELLEQEGLLTVREASELLGVSHVTTYRLIGAGELKSLKIGRARRIPRAAVQAYIEARLAAGDAA